MHTGVKVEFEVFGLLNQMLLRLLTYSGFSMPSCSFTNFRWSKHVETSQAELAEARRRMAAEAQVEQMKAKAQAWAASIRERTDGRDPVQKR